MVPLLSLTEASYKEKEMKEIGKKAQTLYNHLTSLKKVCLCDTTWLTPPSSHLVVSTD